MLAFLVRTDRRIFGMSSRHVDEYILKMRYPLVLQLLFPLLWLPRQKGATRVDRTRLWYQRRHLDNTTSL